MIPDIAWNLFSAFNNSGEELFLVGGCVRDYLAHKMASDPAICEHPTTDPYVPKDLDFATSAPPERTMEILRTYAFPVVPIGIDFGTIQTQCAGYTVEITTYRCDESYTKGSRKPTVRFGETLLEDLARRDFTVNAMAMDWTGKIIDQFGGFSDLVQGLLGCPIDAKVSFSDDPLRMLRAFRFEAEKGLCLTWDTFDAIKLMKSEIHNVSQERITAEFSKLLLAPKPGKTLNSMAVSGLLGEIFPELQTVIDFKQNQGKWHSKLVWPHTLDVVDNTPPILKVRWAALFHDVAKPQTYSESDTGVHFYAHELKGSRIWAELAKRLKLPNEFTEEVEWLILAHLRPCNLSDKRVGNPAIRRFIREAGTRLDNIFHLSMADITSHKPEVVAEKQAACRALRARIDGILAQCDVTKLKLPTGLGSEVAKELGLPHGPELGRIMKQLHEALIAGIISEDSDFIAEAKEVHRKHQAMLELVSLTEELGLYDREREKIEADREAG